MRALLAEIGFAGAALARETPDGLQLIDGHLRAELSPDAKIPVLILDVTEKEAAKLLATFDPIGTMAETDNDALSKLLAEIDIEEDALQSVLDGMAGVDFCSNQVNKPDLVRLDTKAPPKMAWVLIGIPTVRFSEISEAVERLSCIDGTIVETTANDG